jgi:predicted permease
MKHAIYCGLICAAVGFLVAAWVGSVNPSSAPRWMSTTVSYVLCPPGIFAGLSMTDPDADSIWLFFGPLNALIYGAIGFVFWLFFMGDDDTSSENDDSDK